MGYGREASTAAEVLGFIGRLIVYGIVGFMLFEGVTKGYEFGYEIFCPTAVEAAPGRDVTVTLEGELSPSQAADQLLLAGLIRNKAVFVIQAGFYEYVIHPGTYELNTSMTSRDILEFLNEIPDTGEEGDGES